ncbi:Scr1 family TA system antitoxin-like transcriptional regulator [Spirillospora sp. NPDC048911]|uniref:Scr1 family TA system antitoxin-like transcriptional regulator n=1 Tax=Spirillospora sp. NPDC048911 TaxID=3364527 RepID=UPI00371F0A21
MRRVTSGDLITEILGEVPDLVVLIDATSQVLGRCGSHGSPPLVVSASGTIGRGGFQLTSRSQGTPNINIRRLGLYLRRTREIVELSYEEAAARTGCEADWLARVETGFAQPTPVEVERLLERYEVRAAKVADLMVDLATRLNGPDWLAPLLPEINDLKRDALIPEAEACVVRSYGMLQVPHLAQAEPYVRLLNNHALPPRNPEAEWETMRMRQAFRAGGRPRFLDLIIDESTLTRIPEPAVMIPQVQYLLDLSERPDEAKVRIVPSSAPLFEDRASNFDVLEFPGISDRISLVHHVLGMELATVDLSDLWTLIEDKSALPPDDSRDILRSHLQRLTVS